VTKDGKPIIGGLDISPKDFRLAGRIYPKPTIWRRSSGPKRQRSRLYPKPIRASIADRKNLDRWIKTRKRLKSAESKIIDDQSLYSTEHKPSARYTNVCITKGANRSVIPQGRSLISGGRYDLRLNIGPRSPQSVVRNPRRFRGDLLPPTEKGHWLEVVLASDDFRLPRRRYYFFLPLAGPSYVCTCKPQHRHTCNQKERQSYLFIPVIAPVAPDLFVKKRPPSRRQPRTRLGRIFHTTARLRIAIYYKKNLVESQLLTAEIRATATKGIGYSSRIDYSLTSNFHDVSFLPHRDLNILTNDVNDKTHKLIINGDLKEPIVFNLSEDKIREAILAARQALKDVSVKETKGWGATIPTYDSLYGSDNEKDVNGLITDLRTLCPLGWNLWTALLQTQPQARTRLSARLKGSPARPATIQVSRVEGSSLAFPWSFIYEIPLELDTSKHTVCPVLTNGSWKQHVVAALDRCPFEQQHPKKNIICPFGLWGFNHIIEQVPTMPEGRALPLLIKRAHDRPRLVMGISLDLDSKLTKDHTTTLHQQLIQLQIVPSESLSELEAALAEEQLELVYFYCHGRRLLLPGGTSSTPCIEVGNGQGIAPSDITTWHSSDWDENHWRDTSPLVFINGCHTAELTPEALVNFVDSFIGVYAAGVIGTEVLLLQKVANEAAEQLLSLMNTKDKGGSPLGVGEALRKMRLHFLGKGNLLGLAYTPYCSADLKLAN
jgi:hypothetical protein